MQKRPLLNHHKSEAEGSVLQVKGVLAQNRELLKDGLIGEVAHVVSCRRGVAQHLCVKGLKGVCMVIGTKNLTHMKENFKGYGN